MNRRQYSLIEQFIAEVAAQPRVPNQLIDPDDVAKADPCEEEDPVEEASAGGVVGAPGGGMGQLVPASASMSQKRRSVSKGQ